MIGQIVNVSTPLSPVMSVRIASSDEVKSDTPMQCSTVGDQLKNDSHLLEAQPECSKNLRFFEACLFFLSFSKLKLGSRCFATASDLCGAIDFTDSVELLAGHEQRKIVEKKRLVIFSIIWVP